MSQSSLQLGVAMSLVLANGIKAEPCALVDSSAHENSLYTHFLFIINLMQMSVMALETTG